MLGPEGVVFPTDAAEVPHTALLASLGGRLPRVHLLGLEGLTEDLVRADLRTIELERPVLDVVPVPGRELAMIVHDDDRTVLGLLDAGQGTVAPLQGVGRLDSYDFTRDGGYLFSSWGDKAVHRVDSAGTTSRVLENVEAPAGIGYDARRDRVLVPGSMREVPSDKPLGGLWIIEAKDEAEVRDIFKDDPFWTGGLRAQVRINRWQKAFPDRKVPI